MTTLRNVTIKKLKFGYGCFLFLRYIHDILIFEMHIKFTWYFKVHFKKILVAYEVHKFHEDSNHDFARMIPIADLFIYLFFYNKWDRTTAF